MKIKIRYILKYYWLTFCNSLFITPKILKYKLLSDCKIIGKNNRISPILIKGEGEVIFGNNVNIGVVNSPSFYNSYSYIEAS